MSDITSVAITREASRVLDEVARKTGMTKSYLADKAIKFFYTPAINPNLPAALKSLEENRNMAEQEFLKSILNTDIRTDT